jgi:hypothetical protein
MALSIPNFRWNGRAACAVPYQPSVLARRSPRRWASQANERASGIGDVGIWLRDL